jgi:hypothetical protein
MEVSAELHAPTALPMVKELPVPIGFQSLPGRCGEEKNLLPLPGIEPNSLVIQSVARHCT